MDKSLSVVRQTSTEILPVQITDLAPQQRVDRDTIDSSSEMIALALSPRAHRTCLEFFMYAQFLKSGVLSLALLLANGTTQSVLAQHHHGEGGHSGGGHSGGGGHYGGGHYGGSYHTHNGGSGFSLSIGSGYGGLQYSSGYGNSLYGNSYYNSYPSYGYSNYGSGYGYSGSSVYVTPQYVTPTYVTPRYVTPQYITSQQNNASPPIIYQTPSVQPSTRIYIPPQDSGQRSNLPGVSFGGRSHIPELASAVADRANQLCLALHDSYLGNPHFKEVYRDTYSLITRAQQLAQPQGASDSQAMLATLSDMNAILTRATPVIESWTPTSGASASATSHLSRVQAALNLLSIDAGWDEQQATSPPARSETAPAPNRVAPAPESLPSENEPTPLDPLPAP